MVELDIRETYRRDSDIYNNKHDRYFLYLMLQQVDGCDFDP